MDRIFSQENREKEGGGGGSKSVLSTMMRVYREAESEEIQRVDVFPRKWRLSLWRVKSSIFSFGTICYVDH